MNVKNKMTVNPICIHPDQTISEVLDLMHEHKIHRIPVIEKGRLVGLVTQGVVQENSPSNMSTLSIHEMNYLLSKTKVKDIMIRKVVTISPDAIIEEAADTMEKKDIGCLPVVGEDNVLLGIITTNDIMKAFVELFGYHQRGTRIVVQAPENEVGIITKLSSVFTDNDISISHVAVYPNNTNEFIIRVYETDKEKIKKLLESKGFVVNSVL